MYNFITDTVSQNVLKVRGWEWDLQKKGTVRLWWRTPLGNIFAFGADAEDFLAEVNSQYDNFDVDKYVETFIVAHYGQGIATSVRARLEEAEAIEKELNELNYALNHPKYVVIGNIGNVIIKRNLKEGISLWHGEDKLSWGYTTYVDAVMDIRDEFSSLVEN